jgi:hypothetical protein
MGLVSGARGGSEHFFGVRYELREHSATGRGAWSACRRSASAGPETEETAKTCTAPACATLTLAELGDEDIRERM